MDNAIKFDVGFSDSSFGLSFLAGERFEVMGKSSEQVLIEHSRTGTRVRVSITFFNLHAVSIW